jgi:biopolymer transport protein ExbD
MGGGGGPALAASGRPILEGGDDDGLTSRRSLKDETVFDITAMIDLVFMMNIFFMVTTVGAAANEIELPSAQHCVAADMDNAIIITITSGGPEGAAMVYIGDGKSGEAISDPAEQVKEISAAVELGIQGTKPIVVLKADRDLRYKDISRLTAAASAPEGAKLHLAVMEKD